MVFKRDYSPRCIFVWRLSNEVVKTIRTKMRGQGYEPEISADTPNPNRKGEVPLSPHSEYVLPIMDLLSGNKPSVYTFSILQLVMTSVTLVCLPR